MFEYMRDLREAILQFYLGLFQGAHNCGQDSLLVATVPKIIEYALFVV